MKNRIRIGRTSVVAVVSVIVCFAATVFADALDPRAIASLGSSPFTMVGAYTIDTTAMPPVMTRPDSSTIDGAVSTEGIAVFVFDWVQIGPGITISATGTRPLALLSRDSFTLDASSSIDVSGADSTGAAAGAGGPGGGVGGSAFSSGSGPGGGGGSAPAGAAGGGFGGLGGDGGGVGGGLGGSTYGDLAALLEGGSGGGSAGQGAGGGGGALEIGALGDAVVSGTVSANGGNALTNNGDGGGSGGGIFIHSNSLSFTGSVTARGGGGAPYGAAGGTGGGGGGGRVLLQFCDGITSGTIDVDGGAEGAASGGAVAGQPGDVGVAEILSGICTNPVPAVSPLGLAVMLILLAALGVTRLRVR